MISRRKFILSGSAGLAAVMVCPSYFQRLFVFSDRELIITIKGLLKNSYQAAAFSKLYFAENPKEASLSKLLDNLCPQRRQFLGVLTPKKLLSSVREKSKIDFQTGNIVTIGGWILSKTEAQLLALVGSEFR